MERAQWRLVRSRPDDGAWNMAVDEAILESVGLKAALPTLRLYAWDPACLSLGLSQPVKDADQEALKRNGWGLVRRPTGGRAILHADELTYSVIAPLNEPRVAGSVLDSYRRLSQALLQALTALGLPAQASEKYSPAQATPQSGPVCFEVPSNYEITVTGKKLIGSAQARRKEGVLQHGSLPIHGDLTRITRALVYPEETTRAEAAERLLERATTVEMLGVSLTWDQCADAFSEGFSKTLNLVLEEGELTQAELRRAAELVEQKFGNTSWTFRL